MGIHTSPSPQSKIGEVFTPLKWARWLLEKFGVGKIWLSGGTVADPTAGEGVFIEAICDFAVENGVALTKENLGRLYLCDRNPASLERFKRNFKLRFGIEFPVGNIICADIIVEGTTLLVDALIGNPPWVNFCDLPRDYRETLKKYYIYEGLVPDRQNALLGSSRVDLAALILKVCLGRFLKTKGTAFFFIPTSLFFGDDAHRGFRGYMSNGRQFSIQSVWEFTETKIFPGITTSYCAANFAVDVGSEFPIPYYQEKNSVWSEFSAAPLRQPSDPWRVLEIGALSQMDEMPCVTIHQRQKPRQGVNTCGVNHIFIFDKKPDYLPLQYLYPLATKELWREGSRNPVKWILLPYDPVSGKALTYERIEAEPALRDYLSEHKCELESRKGTLLSAGMKNGAWWSLLGVGPYSFAPYKVIWPAYGKHDFSPIILDNFSGLPWQGNQAMHAFIPSWSHSDAKRILTELSSPEIQRVLTEMNGGGKCNWAQPGKIKKILWDVDVKEQSEFALA